MKIVITNDHAAITLKQEIKAHLEENESIFIADLGADDESTHDYPHYAAIAAGHIVGKKSDFGVFLCGTGVGMAITANKIKGIRAVNCSDTFTARLSREHNDANVLCLGARVVGSGLAKDILDTFLNTEFEGGRHQQRIDMIEDCVNCSMGCFS
jgi:ribose 5-phosphate isomerase B